MSWTCEDCAHWNFEFEKEHCSLFSLECVNDIARHKLPPRYFIDRKDVCQCKRCQLIRERVK